MFAQAAHAQQILEVESASLTTYLPTDKTAGQLIRAEVRDRGISIDGGLRAGAGWQLAVAGNPLEGAYGGQTKLGDVWLAAGLYAPTEIDLALPSSGNTSWVIGRTHNHRQRSSSSHYDRNGLQGYNWFQTSQPELFPFDADGNPSTKQAADYVYLFYGADRYLEFKRTADNSDAFKGKNGTAGTMVYASGSPDTYAYYDQAGNAAWFFGGNTSSNRANYQIWKLVDAAGNTSYIGDATTASTAASNGYNTDLTINVAYDATSNDGRKYAYAYTSVGSVSRLDTVSVYTKTGGTWSSPSGQRLVAMVDYDYYTSNESGKGKTGDLKLVTISTSLSDSDASLSQPLVRKKYYRYYDDTWSDSDGRRGFSHLIKMVVGFEGCRSFDWGEDGAETPPVLDDGFLSASDADLKPYAEAYIEYVSGSDDRVAKIWSSGQCGCSGGSGAGQYTLTYGTNGSFSGSSGYDAAWYERTVVAQPDGTYVTQYFDEVVQPLSRVITSSDPSGSPTSRWVQYQERNTAGQVKFTASPANVTGYTHSTGAFTHSSTVGLVTEIERITISDTAHASLVGFAEHTKVKEGTSGTGAYVSSSEYAADADSTKSLKDTKASVTFYSPNVTKTHRYPTAGTTTYASATTEYTEVTKARDSGTEQLVPKEGQSKPKAVDSAKNGAGSQFEAKVAYRTDGQVGFTKSTEARIGYRAYTDGLVAKSIQDADTTLTGSGQDFNGVTIPSGFSSSGAPVHVKTTYTYDAQSRPDTTTLPSSRVTKMYYSKLKDGRMVSIAIPRMVSGGSTTYYGPVSYTVTNHAGRAEFQGMVALSGSGITTALSSWIDENESDPITALDVGTLARMAVSVYDKPGGRLTESRAYFLVPASGAGTAGTNYDVTFYGYDDMNRQRRVKDPTGTLSRTIYDALGRVSKRYIGTNDNDNTLFPDSDRDTTGTSNMVKVEELEYDSGSSGGDSRLTKRTVYVEDSNTDKRETTYLYDYRGRMIVQVNPQAPHVLNKYDNLGRAIATATYNSSSGLDASDDPTSLTTNRVGLSQTFYDDNGRVWKTQRHKIDPADGSDDDDLQSLTWYDPAGRVIKVDGEQLSKTRYDRLGRATHQFTLAKDNDAASTYTDVYDTTNFKTKVDGDTVLTESQTGYDDAKNLPVMRVTISRHHDDGSTTGELDSNADTNALKVTIANVTGRAQITASWYDDLDRLSDTAAYGTNGGSDFDRKPSGTWLTVPSRSDNVLVTSYSYNDDGTMKEVTDPRGLVTRTEYDGAGRRTATIANYVNGTPSGTSGDDDVFTRYVYTSGQQTKMWVDLDGDGNEDSDDQVTTWTYGVT